MPGPGFEIPKAKVGDAVAHALADQIAQCSEISLRMNGAANVYDRGRQTVLVQMEAIACGPPRNGRRQGTGPTLTVGSRAQHRIGIAHGGRLGPRHMLVELWNNPNQIGGASAGRYDSQGNVSSDNSLLAPGKCLGEAQIAPGNQVHARRVQGGRHSRPGSLPSPLLQEL